MDGKDLSAARRHFEPGARTYWHSHDKGQLLLVEEGRMRTQKKGGPVSELGVGESDYAGPNVVHWHGATPRSALVQINVGFGGGTKWLERSPTPNTQAKRSRCARSCRPPGHAARPDEGVRLGTVRRPPRGVEEGDYARLDYYDLWLPELAPSAPLVSWALSKPWTDARWAQFARRYRAEMRAPAAQR